MADENVPEDMSKQGIYLGNAVPKFLRVFYVAYAIWACSYLIRFLLPNLKLWLKRM